MSDTYRRYAAIKRGLMQFYHPHPTGHRARHLNTLLAMICGWAGGQGHICPRSPITRPVTGPIRKA